MALPRTGSVLRVLNGLRATQACGRSTAFRSTVLTPVRFIQNASHTPQQVVQPSLARYLSARPTFVKSSFASSSISQSTRLYSTPPPSPAKKPVESPKAKKTGLFMRFGYVVVLMTGSVVVGVGVLLAGFFIYDASTYSEGDTEEFLHELEIPSLALNPRRGGPKNLPICDAFLDQADTSEKSVCATKPRLVILGSGWGSIALLKSVDPKEYNVTIISPVNYFLFTPLLPSATVGTLELRSLVEPVRRICKKAYAHFLLGSAESVDFEERLIEVVAKDPKSGELVNFYVPYDKLVVGVGSISNTHGVQGLENCNFLKNIEDVKSIRKRVIGNFETASLPTTSDEERKRLLSFVICGGGPTGVELAAELYDLINEDLGHYYPKILRSEASVHIIQSRSHILNTYDQKISEYAMQRFNKDHVDVIVNSRVEEVLPDRVIFTQTEDNGKKVRKELEYGLCVWSTGVGQAPITQSITKTLGPDFQHNRRAIETDAHLRVIGTPQGEVYAIGDCSTVRTDIASQIKELLRDAVLSNRRPDITGGQKGHTVVSGITPMESLQEEDELLRNVDLSYEDLEVLSKIVRRKAPQAGEYMNRLRDLFREFDKDNSGTLSLDELSEMLTMIDKKVTSLPATAQRAYQQGMYLGRKLTRVAHNLPTLGVNDIKHGDIDDLVSRPFAYHHLGSLAYISNAAVFDLNGHSFFGGIVAMYLWRSIYFAQSVSLRNRALMFMDWLKRGLFGRDMSGV